MPRLLRGMARTAAVVGTANAVSHKQQQKYAAEDQAKVQQAAPQASSTGDQIAQLEKLAQLKKEGILTEAEFAAKKAQILGL
ncbi:MAG: SHOCT domain-containing protein [Actinomycetota bacterium]